MADSGGPAAACTVEVEVGRVPRRARFSEWALRSRPWLYPAGVFLLAFAVRLWWVRHWIVPPYGDQPSLETYASSVAHGLYYGTQGAYWPPAFVFLAGLVEKCFGHGHAHLAVRTANAVLAALGAAVTTDLGRRLLRSAEAGLAAGAVLALYAPSIYYTDAFVAVSLETLTLVAVCTAALAYADRPTATRLVLVGVLLGIATLTKPTQLPLLVPACACWGLRRTRGFDWRFAGRSAAAALAVALLVIAPWTLRNLRVTGSAVLVDTNGGVNFLIAHNPGATGTWMDLGPANPVLLRGSGYDQADTDHLAWQAGLHYFLRHPGADLRQAGRVVALFWGMADPDIGAFGGGLRPITTDLHLPLVGFHVLRDLALLGGVGFLWRWRRMAVLWVTALGYCGGLSLLFFAPRFRLPVAPLLAVAAAAALQQLAVGWRAQQESALAAPASGGLFGVVDGRRGGRSHSPLAPSACTPEGGAVRRATPGQNACPSVAAHSGRA